MTNKLKIMGVAAAIAGFGVSVQAVPYIDGSITFNAQSVTVNGSFVKGTGETKFTAIKSPTVATVTQDYSLIPVNTAATFNPFTFAPLKAPNPEWSVKFGGKTYSFIFSSVTTVYAFPDFLAIAGTGTADITGYLPTPGTWSITDTQTGKSAITFSAATSVTPVPDGGMSASLLGVALGCGALFTRRMQKLA